MRGYAVAAAALVGMLASTVFAAGTDDAPDGQRAMASNQSIPCAFRAKVVEVRKVEEPAEFRGYVIDADPQWEITLDVLPHTNKTPFQPGVRRAYIADPETVFGVAADKVQGHYEFSYTWNIGVEGKPEFEAFKARPLTPAERGVLRAQADLEAGTPKVLYSGKPWSADRALIDNETGLPVEIVSGCVVMKEQIEEWNAYNKTVKEASNQTGGWGETSNGLQLRIWTAKRTYKVGEQIKVNFILKNVSPAPVALLDGTDANHCWMHRFTFADADGKAIAFTSPDLLFEGPTTTSDKVAPAGCARHTVVLNHWKLAGLGHPYTDVGTEARSLLVTGTYSPPDGLDMADKTVWYGSVASKPVRIEIVE